MPGLDSVAISRIGASYGIPSSVPYPHFQRMMRNLPMSTDHSLTTIYCQTSLILLIFSYGAFVLLRKISTDCAGIRLHLRRSRSIWYSCSAKECHGSRSHQSSPHPTSGLPLKREDLGDSVPVHVIPRHCVGSYFWPSATIAETYSCGCHRPGDSFIQREFVCSGIVEKQGEIGSPSPRADYSSWRYLPPSFHRQLD